MPGSLFNIFNTCLLLSCVHVNACEILNACEIPCAIAGMWRRSEDALLEWVLSFRRVGTGDQIEITRLGGKHFSPLSHFPGSTRELL